MAYCKTIRDKYRPHVGETFPYDGTLFWKGYYLILDGRVHHGASFQTDSYISDDEKDTILNAYLIKCEKKKKHKPEIIGYTTWRNFYQLH